MLHLLALIECWAIVLSVTVSGILFSEISLPSVVSVLVVVIYLMPCFRCTGTQEK